MRKWALRSVIVLLLLGLLTGTRVGYSADCVLCLRRERGDDFNLFGLRVLHLHQPATDRAGPLQDSYRLPSIPSGDPATLDLLLATPCAHVFKRDGFGRSSLLFGGVACGGYAEGSVFAGRRYALSALAHLHSRVPATPLARQTLAIIDHTFPATLPSTKPCTPTNEANASPTFPPCSTSSRTRPNGGAPSHFFSHPIHPPSPTPLPSSRTWNFSPPNLLPPIPSFARPAPP